MFSVPNTGTALPKDNKRYGFKPNPEVLRFTELPTDTGKVRKIIIR